MKFIYSKWTLVAILFVGLIGYTGTIYFEGKYFKKSSQDTLGAHIQHFKLQQVLKKYESFASAGGWELIPEPGKVIKEGDIDSVIPLVKRRLEREGFPCGNPINDRNLFDKGMRSGVELFQRSCGIPVSGQLDEATVSALNIPLQKRIEQIKVNIARWKLLPADMGDRYLFVNVADFSVAFIEKDSAVLTLKAIVGRTYRSTPVFTAKMTHLVFNPTWNIPATILQEDILPMVLKDTSYLRKRHIRIFHPEKDGNRTEIPVDSVDWETVSIKKFPYELIQDAGKDNMLGVVKFMFPNPYNVYLHDTPSKELFAETERTFSSGCIRVSNAAKLAGYLLKWSNSRVMKTIQSGETTSVNLEVPISVYIQYFTAWVDENDQLQFRKDIYERDSIFESSN